MYFIHHLLIYCIILFHLSPQLTIWSKYLNDENCNKFQDNNYLNNKNQDNNYRNQNDKFNHKCKLIVNHQYSFLSSNLLNNQILSYNLIKLDNHISFDNEYFSSIYDNSLSYQYLSSIYKNSYSYFSLFNNLLNQNSISFTNLFNNLQIQSLFLINLNLNQKWFINPIIGAHALPSDMRAGHRTLRMFQSVACQEDNLKLHCPKNSAISIYSAHFGGLRSAQEPTKLCPHINLEQSNSLNDNRIDFDMDKSSENQVNSTNFRCSSVHAFRIVDSKCKDNRSCIIKATVSEFLSQPNLTLITEQEAKKFKQTTQIMIDLCSSEVTYAEVMYKCKPTSISLKGICENENLHLSCPKKQVLHIYKALYGPLVEIYTAQCKSSINQSNKNQNKNSLINEEEECVTNETDMLIDKCQGYRKCNLIASDDTFYQNQTDSFYQISCRRQKRLKVFYTCTNPKILNDDYKDRQLNIDLIQQNLTITPLTDDLNSLPVADDSSSIEQSSTEQSTTTNSVPNHFELSLSIKPKATKEKGSKEDDDLDDNESLNCTTLIAKKTAIGFISEWVQAVYYVSGNLERLLLYFLVSILFALLCIVIVMSCKLHREKNMAKKCFKQQQIPIFEYIPEEDEDNLMSPTDQQYKQLQRQQLLNSQLNRETNNNLPTRNNNTRTMLLLNNHQQQPTTFYSPVSNQQQRQHLLRNSPTSQINPNYIIPFLNERELIDTNDDDDDEPLEGGFINPSNEDEIDRQNLMVRNFDLKTFKTLPRQQTNNNNTKPILIKNHASTIHLIRCSKPANKNNLQTRTLSALLNGQFNRLQKFDQQQSNADLRPMHALIVTTNKISNNNNIMATTGSQSQNTTLTTNTTASFSNISPQSFSQRTTPQSKVRLLNFTDSQSNTIETSPKFSSLTHKICSYSNPTSPTKSPTTNIIKKNIKTSPLNSPLNSPISSESSNQNSSSTVSASNSVAISPSIASPPLLLPNQLSMQQNNSNLNDNNVNYENDNKTNQIKKPAWINDSSPIKQQQKHSLDRISSVGNNLFENNF